MCNTSAGSLRKRSLDHRLLRYAADGARDAGGDVEAPEPEALVRRLSGAKVPRDVLLVEAIPKAEGGKAAGEVLRARRLTAVRA